MSPSCDKCNLSFLWTLLPFPSSLVHLSQKSSTEKTASECRLLSLFFLSQSWMSILLDSKGIQCRHFLACQKFGQSQGDPLGCIARTKKRITVSNNNNNNNDTTIIKNNKDKQWQQPLTACMRSCMTAGAIGGGKGNNSPVDTRVAAARALNWG